MCFLFVNLIGGMCFSLKSSARFPQLLDHGKDYILDILIRKKSLDPIGLHEQGVIANYIPKFQVATMSLEVA